MASLDSQRDLFGVPDEIAYLNTANMSPLRRSVRDAGARALAWSATRRSTIDDGLEALKAKFRPFASGVDAAVESVRDVRARTSDRSPRSRHWPRASRPTAETRSGRG
jgi:hypothetical protein